MDELNKRWDDYAVYLPSIQKAYAKLANSTTDKNRTLPNGVNLKSLNFLNPKSKLWHFPNALYSVGQFKLGETQGDIVTNRDIKNTLILGDSGGFQIGKGTLAGFTALDKCKTADEVCAQALSARFTSLADPSRALCLPSPQASLWQLPHRRLVRIQGKDVRRLRDHWFY